jgi:hypothetical protein
LNGADRFHTALAGLEFPAEWQVDVAIRPRLRSVGIEVKPGGAVAILRTYVRRSPMTPARQQRRHSPPTLT